MMKIIIFKNDYLLISFISVNWLLSFFFCDDNNIYYCKITFKQYTNANCGTQLALIINTSPKILLPPPAQAAAALQTGVARGARGHIYMCVCVCLCVCVCVCWCVCARASVCVGVCI